MGGIENDLFGGLYYFKFKFELIIEEFIGEFNILVNRLFYKVFNYVYVLCKKCNSQLGKDIFMVFKELIVKEFESYLGNYDL